MNWLRRLREALASEQNVFAGHIDQVLLPAGIVALLALTPFQINNLLQGRWLQTLIVLPVHVVLLIDVVALWRRRPVPVGFAWLLLPMLAGMVQTIHALGVYGALWSYPIVMACYFVLGRLQALCFSLGVLLLTTLTVTLAIDPLLAVRVFATLGMTILLTHLVVGAMVRLHRSLLEQALTDPLTGAFNRRHMSSELAGLVSSELDSGPANALLALDIDGFKSINDSLGHDAGDRVLREVVQLIQSRKRGADLLFRSGGEEFTLLLHGVGRAGAQTAAEALRALIAAAPILPGRAVTVSIGVSMQSAGLSRENWLKQADDALYRAKQAGRNRVEMAA